jgi:hypothetical protein
VILLAMGGHQLSGMCCHSRRRARTSHWLVAEDVEEGGSVQRRAEIGERPLGTNGGVECVLWAGDPNVVAARGLQMRRECHGLGWCYG